MTDKTKDEENAQNSGCQCGSDECENNVVKISDLVVEMMSSLASISAIKRCLEGSDAASVTMAERAHDAIFEAVKSYLEGDNLKRLQTLQVSDYIGTLFTTLSSLGYLRMGLPETNAQYLDLEDAKLAIDTFSGLFDAIEENLDEEQTKQLVALRANLQMTYVEKTKEHQEKV